MLWYQGVELEIIMGLIVEIIGLSMKEKKFYKYHVATNGAMDNLFKGKEWDKLRSAGNGGYENSLIKIL
jgi:hypothetical protein